MKFILLLLICVVSAVTMPQARAEDDETASSEQRRQGDRSNEPKKSEEGGGDSKPEPAPDANKVAQSEGGGQNPASLTSFRSDVVATYCTRGDCYRGNPLGTAFDPCFGQNMEGCIRPGGKALPTMAVPGQPAFSSQ